MHIIVIERDYRDTSALRNMVIGSIYEGFNDAQQLVFSRCPSGCALDHTFVDNGDNYIAIDRYTGEIVKEFYVRLIDIPKDII